LLDVQLEFLAFFLAVGMRFFRGRDSGARAVQLGVGLPDALGESVEFGPQRGDLMINALQFDEVRDCWMHVASLTHRGARLCRNASGG
jgi:hypothetical protein